MYGTNKRIGQQICDGEERSLCRAFHRALTLSVGTNKKKKKKKKNNNKKTRRNDWRDVGRKAGRSEIKKNICSNNWIKANSILGKQRRNPKSDD